MNTSNSNHSLRNVKRKKIVIHDVFYIRIHVIMISYSPMIIFNNYEWHNPS